MLADDVYGALRNYINQTLVGMGALKGASAQLSNEYDAETGTNTMTWTWEDNEGTSHTTQVVVYDGAQGAPGSPGAPGTPGTPGADGVSPTITVKTDTATTYILTITAAGVTFDTPNLKGSSTLEKLTDVAIESMSAGDVLQYDAYTAKWINAAIATMDGATSILPGTAGLVPAPAAGDNEKLLCGNGTFTDKVLTDAQYAALQTLFS